MIVFVCAQSWDEDNDLAKTVIVHIFAGELGPDHAKDPVTHNKLSDRRHRRRSLEGHLGV